MWPLRCPHLQFDDGDYEQKDDTELKQVSRRQSVRRRANPFTDTEAKRDGDASSDDRIVDENNDLNDLIVADDEKY